ncbi:MAG: HAD-IC family P-type ATPase [Gammaproteobacteria bacterium]|jgi:magnesium-transporting ATPase (P-type)|nr:HAD-IC family P-type ATPase [Gammaproteobacteria bacterium]
MDSAGSSVSATAGADTRKWHSLPAEQLFEQVEAGAQGLDSDQAARRLAHYGPNRSRPPERPGSLARFLRQFHNFLIYVLLASAAILAALEHWLDASVVFGVTLINALIGFIQEGKAERAFESIQELLAPSASVVRDGQRVTVQAFDLVPGDLVLLDAGDRVPADMRLLSANALEIQQAVLTGESIPVEKSIAPVHDDAPVAERNCMAYSSTLVTHGQGSGLVVATADATEIGHVGRLLAGVASRETPLLRQLSRFGRWLTAGIVVLAVATFAYGRLVHDFAAIHMFLAALGLAVAAIPEGLPAIVTITLAIGVERMTKLGAIIRHLPAVETLGSVNVVCCDKTGTLTRNEMMVKSIATTKALYRVTGNGYAPHGDFRSDGVRIDAGRDPQLRELLEGAALCNDAGLGEQDGEWQAHGDPTEGALLAAAAKGGIDYACVADRRPRSDAIPFESANRFMATLHPGDGAASLVYVKGAPEKLLTMATRQRGVRADEPMNELYWRAQMLAIAGRAERVIALAVKHFPDHRRQLTTDDVRTGLTLLGLFGIADPIREEAVEAVARCQSAGIQVKMITGDHAATACAVARELAIADSDQVLTGSEVEELDDQSLSRRISNAGVFARTSPEHKLRLVQSLQDQGSVVAMTGDGVNDAPALKRADVGVAMGRKGTEVAKEASQVVITDDNFATIVAAIEQGRTVYDNIRKAIVWILPTSFGEAFVIIVAVLFGLALPITALQVLWINMVTTVTLALALAFESPERDIMNRPPRRSGEAMMSRFVVWRTLMVSILFVIGTFTLFRWQLDGGAPLELARTVAVNTIVMCEIFYLFNVRRMGRAGSGGSSLMDLRPALIASALVLVFQAAFTYLPAMQGLFGTAPLTAWHWLVITAVAFGVYLVVELEKRLLPATRPVPSS